ncbi:MAG: insulinase family protein [Candidatus Eisenbacteria sp.]|nr:insulinase family protein [Candidatus Eisenbacteria bacterium]
MSECKRDEPSRAAPIAERVQEMQLANGARIFLLEDHTHPATDLLGLFSGGLSLEAPGESGLADLTLGLLDRGTRQRSERQLSEALESNGAELDYRLMREAAVVHARCLSEDLSLVLEIVGETLCAASFPEDQIRLVKEQALVGLHEIAYDTYEQASRRATAMLLGAEHPYAREPLGRAEVVTKLTRSDLVSYRDRALRGSRLLFALVGDFDPQVARGELERHLGALPGEEEPCEVPPDPAIQSPTSAKGWRREHVPIADKGQVDLVFVGPGIPRTRPGFEAYGMANFLLGGSFVSRLNQSLRDEAGLTYGAHSAIVSGLAPGYWFASLSVDPADVEAAVARVRDVLHRFVDEGVTEQELEEAKAHLTGTFPLQLETARAVAAIFLDGVRFGRGRDYIDRYRERVAALTRKQVTAAGRELIDPERIVLASAGSLVT